MKPSLDVVARFVADDYFSRHAPEATADQRMALATRIETALRAAINEEREACAVICDKRQELWQRSEAKSPPAMRTEARARSVEAAYLGDAIRAQVEND